MTPARCNEGPLPPAGRRRGSAIAARRPSPAAPGRRLRAAPPRGPRAASRSDRSQRADAQAPSHENRRAALRRSPRPDPAPCPQEPGRVGGHACAHARWARSRMRSSTPARPRRRPVARARSTSSSPAMPRRRRYAAKSKPPRAFRHPRPSGRRRTLRLHAAGAAAPEGQLGAGARPGRRVQRGMRRSSRAPLSAPVVTRTSAVAPKTGAEDS